MQEKIWRCDCGGSHFVSIQKPYDDTPVLSIELYEVYRTFSDRIHHAWAALRCPEWQIDEVLLTPKTAQEIVDTITALMKEKNGQGED